MRNYIYSGIRPQVFFPILIEQEMGLDSLKYLKVDDKKNGIVCALLISVKYFCFFFVISMYVFEFK